MSGGLTCYKEFTKRMLFIDSYPPVPPFHMERGNASLRLQLLLGRSPARFARERKYQEKSRRSSYDSFVQTADGGLGLRRRQRDAALPVIRNSLRSCYHSHPTPTLPSRGWGANDACERYIKLAEVPHLLKGIRYAHTIFRLLSPCPPFHMGGGERIFTTSAPMRAQSGALPEIRYSLRSCYHSHPTPTLPSRGGS